MALYRKIGNRIFVPLLIATGLLAVSCSKLDDVTETAHTAIKKFLNDKNIYQRDDVPIDPAPPTINGYYDLIDGAYRYITNEDREERYDGRAIVAGDEISFYFEAYVFSTSYESSTPFFTNIRDRIVYIGNNNPQFNVDKWSSEPLKIKVGEDSQILKSIQNTLPTCKPGDEVRIFLPPNVAYGLKGNGIVEDGSSLVFILTDIEIIE